MMSLRRRTPLALAVWLVAALGVGLAPAGHDGLLRLVAHRATVSAAGPAVAAAALFAVVQRLAHTPSKVERVTIVNPTPYDLEVEVSGADRSTGLTLGAVDREQTKTIEAVIDQGDQWVFRFSRGHDAVGDL